MEGIYYDTLGVCLDAKAFDSPTGFANLILQDMETYRPASLVLREQRGLFPARGCPEIMKVLCGDAEPSDMADFVLRRPAMELLRSLLKGEYLLEWTLELEVTKDSYHVSCVTLPSI
uniref:Uncharacterized protein n=1 Tax=Grammatophora oceanica TaxID=210454 RepID=A0A7S1Y119_9STRA